MARKLALIGAVFGFAVGAIGPIVGAYLLGGLAAAAAVSGVIGVAVGVGLWMVWVSMGGLNG